MASPETSQSAARSTRRVTFGRLARLLLVALSLCVALGAAELAVRIVAPQSTLAGLDFLVADPELGWRHEPNVDRVLTNHTEYRVRVVTDERGLRIAAPGGASGSELLALGDSYVFGWGVKAEETLFVLAGDTLGDSVANAGVAGYTPCQAAALGVRLIDALHPKVAVLALFLGNDEREAGEGTAFWEIRDGALVHPGWRPSPWRALTHPLFQSSHLLRLARFSAPVKWIERRIFHQKDDFRSAVDDILLALREPLPPAIAAGDREIAGCLPALRDAAAARSTPLLAVLIPDWTQVDRARLDADAAVVGASGLDPSRPASRLSRLLGEAGIPVFDLRPAIAAAIARGESLYFPVDRHFTPLGHRRAAEALVEPIRKLLSTTPPGR